VIYIPCYNPILEEVVTVGAAGGRYPRFGNSVFYFVLFIFSIILLSSCFFAGS
jgi:hypothetical protein